MTSIWVQVAEAGYGREVVLHDVRIQLEPYALTLLVGANASGKSTVMRAILGRLAQSRGAIHESTGSLPLGSPEFLSQVGYVPQGVAVFSGLSVADNLEVASYGISPSESRAARGRVLASFPELVGLERRLAGALSGGQRSLVALAMAMMRTPRVYLLDEPLAGLDSVARGRVLAALGVLLQSGACVLAAEHNFVALTGLARHAVGLSRGRVVFAGPGGDLTRPEVLVDIFGQLES